MHSLKQKQDNKRNNLAPRITCSGATRGLSQEGQSLAEGGPLVTVGAPTGQNSKKG